MGQVTVYKTIRESVEGEFTDRGSKFIAYAHPVQTREEFETHLQGLRTEHFKARHHCYAYRLLPDGSDYRANDDGEPSGTSGKPILGRIDSYGLTYICVIVVRYFGGTLLGTGGLIQAYRLSADNALSKAAIIEKDVWQHVQIQCDLESYHVVMKNIKEWDAKVINETFESMLIIELEIPKKLSFLLRKFQVNNPKFEVKWFS